MKKPVKKVLGLHILASSLDGNLDIRNALIERIKISLDKTKIPVIVLHQIAVMIEMDSE